MADNREIWISELKRIYKISTEAINTNETALAEELASDFNEVIGEIKKRYPDNDIIDSIEVITGVWLDRIEEFHTKPEVLSIIRNRSGRAARSLDLELQNQGPEVGNSKLSSTIPDINIHNENNISQSVDVQTKIRNQVADTSLNQNEKEEIYCNLDEYWSEFDSDEPDKSKMQRIAKKIREYSPDVAANIIASAILNGIFSVV